MCTQVIPSLRLKQGDPLVSYNVSVDFFFYSSPEHIKIKNENLLDTNSRRENKENHYREGGLGTRS